MGSGLLFGAMLPMLFAAITMISVGKAAAEIIQEVRRQFNEVTNAKGFTLRSAIEKASQGISIPEDEEVKPDSNRCVMISTRSSVKEMIAPGAYAILAPIFIGFLVGPRCLMGTLAGALVCGCMLAILMSNAGGAWDNSKKLCEKLKIKKTEQGKACVVGDTVGDPFKDTSGPALNILIKLMSMVSLTIAPLIRGNKSWDNWHFGLVPLGVFIIITGALIATEVLTWADPLAKFAGSTVAADVEKLVAMPETIGNAVALDDVDTGMQGDGNKEPRRKGRKGSKGQFDCCLPCAKA